MVYEPVKPKKIYEEIADTFIAMIKKGELKPGDKLDSIEHLAKSFAVSRSVIREALSGLRAMGLVQIRQGEGTFIASFSPENFYLPVTTAFLMKQDDVKELFEVRNILEVGAVKTAAVTHTDKDLVKIKAALGLMECDKQADHVGEKADYQFHLAIAEATHNQMLINLLNSVSDIMLETIRETRKLIFYSEEKRSQLHKEHHLIFEAIKKRQPEKAQHYMMSHLQGVEHILSAYIGK